MLHSLWKVLLSLCKTDMELQQRNLIPEAMILLCTPLSVRKQNKKAWNFRPVQFRTLQIFFFFSFESNVKMEISTEGVKKETQYEPQFKIKTDSNSGLAFFKFGGALCFRHPFKQNMPIELKSSCVNAYVSKSFNKCGSCHLVSCFWSVGTE